jgi:hypothetical protein
MNFVKLTKNNDNGKLSNVYVNLDTVSLIETNSNLPSRPKTTINFDSKTYILVYETPEEILRLALKNKLDKRIIESDV